MVADASRFLRRDAHRVFPLLVLHAIASDRAPPAEAAESLAAAGIDLLLPQPPGAT